NFGSTANNDFTGDTQDTIAGTYDTTNRELNPSQGRWLSPDPAGLQGAERANPQSWNRYIYVLSNPLSRVDPDGRLTIIVPGTGWNSNDWNLNMKVISEAKEKFHDSDVRILGWTGDLGSGAITKGAQQLRDIVDNHVFGPNEQLNII